MSKASDIIQTFKFELYCLDTETTGLDNSTNEIIELSIHRFSSGETKTWCLKSRNIESISTEALRVNGHKLDDLKHLTVQGRERYHDPAKVIAEVENWMLEDGMSDGDRVLVAQNPTFDMSFLQRLWKQEGCEATFPFGPRPFTIDTREIALFIDLLEGTRSEYYNLGSLIKRYGIKNSKAHSAESDTLATKELFLAQLAHLQKNK